MNTSCVAAILAMILLAGCGGKAISEAKEPGQAVQVAGRNPLEIDVDANLRKQIELSWLV